VYALRGSFRVDAVDTEARNHATELSRQAAADGYDLVVAFGGDGTVNEAANGLAGTDTPLSCLPGGRVNVYCRMLGIPSDVVDATEHLLGLAEHPTPRRVDLGTVNGRHFLVNAGVGIDASIVRAVDAHPQLKARFGEWYYAAVGTGTFTRRYLLGRPPRLAVALPGSEPIEGVTAVVQNGERYTYFGERPIDLIHGAELASGDLAGVVLKRTTPLELPSITFRMLARQGLVAGHRQVSGFTAVRELTVRSLDDRPLPLQVDGDYIGAAALAEFSIAPEALAVVA
jgi:diacylglycerol kinase family enzyme